MSKLLAKLKRKRLFYSSLDQNNNNIAARDTENVTKRRKNDHRIHGSVGKNYLESWMAHGLIILNQTEIYDHSNSPIVKYNKHHVHCFSFYIICRFLGLI